MAPSEEDFRRALLLERYGQTVREFRPEATSTVQADLDRLIDERLLAEHDEQLATIHRLGAA